MAEPKTPPPPPAARGNCVFGNTFQFLRDTTGLLLSSYRELGPVYRLRALWLKYTVIAGFEAREFMRQGLDDRHLSREEVFAEVGRQLGSADFVLGQSGPKHARFRRLLSLAYSREVASAWVPEMVHAVRTTLAQWPAGTPVPVMEAVQRLSFEQYCQVMCGRSLGAHYRDCRRVTDTNMNVGGRVWPFLMYHTPWYRASRRRVLDLMWGLVRERRDGDGPGEKSAIMDTLMTLRDGSGAPLTDDEVVCYSMYGFAGSCSYMGRLVAFMLYELLRHPDLMADVTAEVDRAFADGLRNATDVRGMPLLQAVYHETLRFHPVSQGMPHVAARDFDHLGYRIRKGELVVLSQVPMSFSACPFHRPEVFDPTRCLEPRSEHRRENAFHPFGIGHRTCTATGLVELMAITQVATLLHEVRFRMDPAGYSLRFEVKPLPAPDRRFRLRIDGHRQATDRRPATRPVREDLVVASLPGIEDPDVQALLDRAQTVSHPPRATIVREGDPADAFYVIVRGEAWVSRGSDDDRRHLARLVAGECFGEIGLLQGGVRTATVTAGPDGTEVRRIDGATFTDLVRQSDLVAAELSRLIQRRLAGQRLLEALPALGEGSVEAILPGFRQADWPAGHVVLREGDVADAFHVVVTGEVVVTRRTGAGGAEEVARLGPGRYFGEAGLLTGLPRNATVTVATGQPATLLSTDRAGFLRLLEPSGGLDGNLAQALLARIPQDHRTVR